MTQRNDMRFHTKKAEEFVYELYKQPEDAPSKSVLFCMRNLYELISQNNYVVIEDIFENVQVSKLSTVLGVCLMRVTTHSREHIPSYMKFGSKLRAELNARNLDTDELLQGLRI